MAQHKNCQIAFSEPSVNNLCLKCSEYRKVKIVAPFPPPVPLCRRHPIKKYEARGGQQRAPVLCLLIKSARRKPSDSSQLVYKGNPVDKLPLTRDRTLSQPGVDGDFSEIV
ncbi:Hypothetical predicted protein [Scomber scombrus]|uniref:Uncharacterized protein n=1 Tax=Scomber scombrus TaxID=13677 RepID=A0AAV1MSX0_SCOSC